MARKKGIFKKILGAGLAIGGTLLGIGAIKGAAKGIGIVGGITKSLKKGKRTIDGIGIKAANLVTGTTKAEREQVRAVKAESRAAQDKLDQVKRLTRAGASLKQARASVGLSEEELPEFEGETTTEPPLYNDEPANPGNKKMLIYAGAALAALFILPKLFKR